MTQKMVVPAFGLGLALLAAAPALAQVQAAPKPAAAGEQLTEYTVKPGDSLWSLGDKYFVRPLSYKEVRTRNKVRAVRRLKVGLQLEIPTRLLRTEPIEATLGAFRGNVAITGAGAAGAPQVGMIVHEGAVVATQAGSFARLDLPDGTRISVPSQSRLRVDAMHKVLLTGAVERSLTVLAGRSESTVTPLTGPQDSYYVKTPVSVSAVRGTDFRVAYDPAANVANTGVVEGKVAVDGDAGSALTPAGYGVGVKPGAALAPAPLLKAPAVKAPGRVQDAPRLAFDIDPLPGAKAYRIQLGADAGMQDIFAEQAAADPHIEFDGLPDGDYFFRVTALDPADIEGLPRTFAFERALNTLSGQPVAAAGRKGDRHFLIKWDAGGAGERTFRVQVSLAGSKDGPLIDESGLKEPQLTLTNLPPGDYTWQVMSATVRKGRYVEKWSAPQAFTVSAE